MEKIDNATFEKETKENLPVPMLFLAFMVCSWLVYTYVNRSWLDTFNQVIAWTVSPALTYTSVPIVGISVAFLATIESLFLGLTTIQTGFVLQRRTKKPQNTC